MHQLTNQYWAKISISFSRSQGLDKKLEMNRLLIKFFGKMKHLFFYRP